jgi:tRNA(Ile)-lysidine synthase
MSDVKKALEQYTIQAARDVCSIKHGAVEFDISTYRTLPNEVARRLLLRAILWINNATYPPRRGAVKQLQISINKGVSATLDGCQLTCKQAHFVLFREPNAVRQVNCGMGEFWDERWKVSNSQQGSDLTVAALGETGIRAAPTWRDLGLPRGAVLSLPAVWNGDDLVALPALADQQEWKVELKQDADTFFATLLSH